MATTIYIVKVTGTDEVAVKAPVGAEVDIVRAAAIEWFKDHIEYADIKAHEEQEDPDAEVDVEL